MIFGGKMKRENQMEVPTDIILKKQVMSGEIRKINEEFYLENGRRKKYFIETYGCQMNEHDSEKLSGMLLEMGYDEGDDIRNSDLVIYNTCCVRENAELRVFGNLGSLKPLKKKNKDLTIAVCGCMMQQPHIIEQIKKKYSHVDLIFGTYNVHNFPSLLYRTLSEDENMLVEVWDKEMGVIEDLPVNRRYSTKAYVNIVYGCNNFCTYCIVPYTRGRERSRTREAIMEEIKDLAENGAKEITLLGQNVNSYGKTLDEDIDFADLLEAVNKIDGIERIRFMTSHPKDISKKLIDVMARSEKVCHQLHLPVQSGSNEILKKMNRNYSREKYMEMVDYAREKMPDISISTDFIIGFPGETDKDIEDTIDLIKYVQYDSAFTFIYSIRTGTPAAKMEDQIPEKIKHERFEKVLKELNKIVTSKLKNYKDKRVRVLVEGTSAKDENILTGRNEQYVTINFKGDKSLIGKFVNVKITKTKSFSLYGEITE